MPSPFENLSGPGKPLKAEPADAKEFAGLKRAGLARQLDSPRSKSVHQLSSAHAWPQARATTQPVQAAIVMATRPGITCAANRE